LSRGPRLRPHPSEAKKGPAPSAPSAPGASGFGRPLRFLGPGRDRPAARSRSPVLAPGSLRTVGSALRPDANRLLRGREVHARVPYGQIRP
jgi:hypothetical protein